MGLSFNGFIAEVRRHFGKYTPYHKASMMYKFSLGTSVVALALIATGVFVDQYHSEDPVSIDLPNGLVYHAAGVSLGTNRIKLTFPECETPEKGIREQSPLFDPHGVSFKELMDAPKDKDEVYERFLEPGEDTVSAVYFGDFKSFFEMGRFATIFAWLALSFQALSVIISIITRTPPSAFLTDRPVFNLTNKERRWGILHHGLQILAALFLFIVMGVVSTYLDQVQGRVIELSFELCNFKPADNELDTLKLYGHFLNDFSVQNGITGGLFRIAIAVIGLQMVLVFFQGTDQVRSESVSTGYAIPASKMRNLAWYCAIWRFRFALLFFVVAYLTDVICSVYTREHGYPLNMYAFRTVASIRTGTGSTKTGALSDVVMDKVSEFSISNSIPKTLMAGCLMLVVALGIGSTDPSKFFSKLVQIFAWILFLKAMISMSTIVPVPSTIISTPDCYEPPPESDWSIKGIFGEARTCNHLMFSVTTAVTTSCLFVVMMYVRYGPATRHVIAYAALLLVSIGCSVLPVLSRSTYSMDAFIGLVFGLLIVMSQSMAFKLLFRFDFRYEAASAFFTKLNFKPGELLNDKVIPTIEECVRRIEMYQVAAKDYPGLKMSSMEVEELSILHKNMGDAMGVARAAKPIEPTSPVGPMRRNAYQTLDIEFPATPDEPIDDIIEMMSSATRKPSKALDVNPPGSLVEQPAMASPVLTGIVPSTQQDPSQSGLTESQGPT